MQKLLTTLFYAYAFLLAPRVRTLVMGGLESDTAQLWPGLIILAALILETLALPWQITAITRDKPSPWSLPLALGSAIGIAHMLLTYFLGFTMLDAWGFMGGETSNDPPAVLLGTVSIGLFLREGYLFFATCPPSCAARRVTRAKTAAAAVMMLAFQCIAYTVYWEALLRFGPMGDASIIEWIFVVPGVILAFQMVYLPIRLPDFVAVYTEHTGRDARPGVLWILFTGAVLAVLPLLGL